MTMTLIGEGLHMLSHRGANMYLLESGEGLTLIDTGFPDSAPTVLNALRELRRSPSDLRDIVLTHAHYDHIGSVAELAEATRAQTWIHPLDKEIAEGHADFRATRPAPGILRHLLFKFFVKPGRKVAACRIDHTFSDGDVLPLAGGLRVVHVPGHCAGQAAFLWESRGVLFTADACMNVFGLGDPIAFEDQALGRQSQRKLAALEFAVACFGHGSPITTDAAKAFRAKWR